MKYLFANWKLNPIPKDPLYPSAYTSTAAVQVVVFPPATLFDECVRDGLQVGSQFGSSTTFGAHTGELNMPLLKQAGCSHVLCGHSERRRNRSETNEQVAAQVAAALEAGLIPVLCIGETKEERMANRTETVLSEQLAPVQLTSSSIIAYEPVWAIGTGVSATLEQIKAVHAFLQQMLAAKGLDVAILYGGSMNGENCKDIIALPHVAGGLVGGASLKPAEFASMVAVCS